MYFSAITTDTLISEVEIIWILMFSAARASNILLATPGVGPHAHTYNGNLGDLTIAAHLTGTQLRHHLVENGTGALKVIAMNGEGEIGGVVGTHVLHDHVEFDVLPTDRTQNPRGHTRNIGYTQDRQFGFIAVEGDARR